LTATSSPTQSPAWQKLQTAYQTAKSATLQSYFDANEERCQQLQFQAAGLTADVSRHHIDDDILSSLLTLAKERGMAKSISQLYAGESINFTEQRPALHMTLRYATGPTTWQNEVKQCLMRMKALCQKIHHQQWLGFSKQAITDVVNIGIGGSDLGPKMVTEALRPFHNQTINCHFVSNVDPADIEQVLATLNPATTLFIVASKSWATLETLSNADTAKQWLLTANCPQKQLTEHFIAISSRPDRCIEYGIKRANVLPMWDWVGGRFSLWSAIGLVIAIATSFEDFEQLLAGAGDMDAHFQTSTEAENLPLLLALLEVWYVNFWGCTSHAVLPYNHHLRLLPDHLQQLIMESNGKHVTCDNQTVQYQTCPVIWGAAGTNGQHSFHQLLHQGTAMIPVDFILPLTSHSNNDLQHGHLVANCLAQAQALMDGKNQQDCYKELQQTGISHTEAETLAIHKAISGNKPSTIISMDALTPHAVGALVALYEHKVFCSSVIWNINAFDQWGVELGKLISTQIHDALSGQKNSIDNPATKASIDQYKAAKQATIKE
jgi:glucose-6-phosphate isomerase